MIPLSFIDLLILDVINRFIFCHCVLIYFIMQSLPEKEGKSSIVFLLSEREKESVVRHIIFTTYSHDVYALHK